ncbi:hypothetical protein [Streptomyces sp. NPDC052496]|uniref:hypothetical protein n=1 Tax=Streptomyces sp. NPDC052496 TaxID=3154951 RepID=UPI003442764A
MRVRLALAGTVLAAAAVVPAASTAVADDGPARPAKTDAKVHTADTGFGAIPPGNRELVGRIMTGLG